MKLNCIQKQFQSVLLFINKFNWEGIRYPSKLDDWKMFEKNNPTIALNVLYTKEREILRACI